MLTTLGLWSWAIVRNVVASIAPVSGALLVAGTLRGPANEPEVNSRRDARTMPAVIDASDRSTA